MICSNCGATVPAGAPVCPVCGAAQAADTNPQTNAGAYYGQPAPGYGYQPGYAAGAFEPSKAKTAQTLGIVGLCLQYFSLFPFVSLILCIAAVVTAGGARPIGGEYPPSAKVGRTCGILGIVLAGLKVLAAVVVFLLIMVFFGSLTGLLTNLPDIIEGFEEQFLLIGAMN